MSNKREALEAAKAFLWSLQSTTDSGVIADNCLDLINTIDSVLLEPEQEPVRWLVDDAVWERKPTTDDVQMWKDCGMEIMPTIRPLYTSPQPREWQELNDKEIISAISIDQSYNWPYKADENTPSRIAKRIYTALRAKNGFTSQPREWQELSEEGINETFRTAACQCLDGADSFRRAVYTAISAALRAKNGG